MSSVAATVITFGCAMTFGGVLAALLLVVGAVWMSNEVGSNWPITVALTITGVSVAWRGLEYMNARSQVRQLDRAFELDGGRRARDEE